MSIETTLTLVIAAGILLGAVALRAAVHGGIRLFVIVREWVQPTPARHRAPTQRVFTLDGPAKRAKGTEDTGPLAQVLASSRRP